MGFLASLNSLCLRLKISISRWNVNRRHQDIAVFRCSEHKPPRVQERGLTLFYRPRTLWVAAQVVFFTALAMWTVKNYLEVIKSL